MSNGFGLYGKLLATGQLVNVGNRTPLSYTDGSTDVPLAAIPDPTVTPLPWGYNAQTQLAISLRRVPRTLLAIYTDLKALTAQQQGAIWTDISSGSPAKYFSDQGAEPGAVSIYDFIIFKSGLPGPAITDAQFRLVAIYTRDNPTYLVNPPFAPTVNVPGDQPA